LAEPTIAISLTMFNYDNLCINVTFFVQFSLVRTAPFDNRHQICFSMQPLICAPARRLHL